MGMFDYVRCEYPLQGNPPIDNWLTKDLGERHDAYVITADGRLQREEYDTEDQSDPNAKGWRRALGCSVSVNQRLVDMPDFSGEIKFYRIDDNEFWWVFSALFDDGKLLSIKQINSAPSGSTEKKEE